MDSPKPHLPHHSSASEINVNLAKTSLNFDDDETDPRPGLGSDEEEGFASGEEDFGPVVDRAFVRGGPALAPEEEVEVVENGKGVKLVSSSEFFLRPIAKVSGDSDDGEEQVQGEEVFEEAGESSVAEKGLSFAEVVKENGGGVEKPKVAAEEGLGSVLEVVEANGAKEVVRESSENGVGFAGGGDSVVEAVQVGLTHTGAAVVGDVEKKIEESEIKGLEVPAGVRLENEFDKISSEVEEPKEAEVVVAEAETDGVVIAEPEPAVEKSVEERGVDVADSVVEAVHVDLTHTGAAVVGDVDKIEESEIRGLEVPAGVSLENGFDQIGRDSELPSDTNVVAVDLESEKVVVADSADDELVEEEGSEGDSVVQAVHVDLSHTGAAVVGDVEKIEESEIKGIEVPAGVSLENGFDQIGRDSELPSDTNVVAVDLESEKVVVADSADDELVEEEGSEGDSVVQAVHVDLSHTGAAVVGDVEKIEESEIKGIEVPAGVSLENGFNQISHDVELPSESDKVFVADSGNVEEKTVVADEVDLEGREDKELELKSSSAPGQEEPSTKVSAAEVKVVPDETLSVNHVSEDSVLNAAESVEKIATDREIRLEEEENSLSESGIGSLEPSTIAQQEISVEAEYDDDDDEDKDDEGENDGVIFGSSAAAKQFLEELERESGTGSYSAAESYGERSLSYRDESQRVDGQIVTDSDEEVDTDEEGGGKELFDSAALAALLKAATGGGASDGGNGTFSSPDGSRLFSVERPAGLGSSMRPMRPGARLDPSALFSNAMAGGDTDDSLTEEERMKLEKFQQIRVKFLRLVQRLGVSTEDSIVKQVLYRLNLVSGRLRSREFSEEAAKTTALELEADGKDDLDFSLNILVLGKTGVGKSATINSIFREEKTPIYAFGPATTTVKEIVGVVDGIKIRVFDTPGLKSAAMEQNVNRKILSSVQKFTKKCPPDIVLYVDRLDTQSRDLNDVPVLRSITSAFGPSIWRSTIVTLTHAASAPPDGPSGSPLNYELFVAQRSQILQQTIGQAMGDIRFSNPGMMSPISLVENHPSCRKNREGEKVLPNGQSWRPQLLLLSSSMKVLAEATNLSKPAESFDHRKLFGFRTRSAPLPYLLSWLLQPRAHPKLSGDQGGENADSDIDLADLSDSDNEEEEDEYDQLPSFKPLKKSQIAKLSKEQKKAYLEEYDYRVKLLQKKMWREELKRMKEMKKGNKASADEYGYLGEEDPENGAPAAVPVALPDMNLPVSFDSDNPAYRYRFLEPTSQFLARPVLDAQGWDHDCGYDGVNVEFSEAIVNTFPATVAVQVTKDKKEFNLHMDSSVAAKHGENGSSMAGFDIQNIGKQLAYIVRGETKWKNLKRNKTAAGVSVTFLGENVSTGVKLEDQIAIGKRLVLVGTAGTVRSQGDSAYGANLEVRLREADFPIGQNQSTLGLSLVKWRGDLALGANLQSQLSLGRDYKIALRAGLNNKRSGQISIRTSSSEQLQIALVAVVPIVRSIYNLFFPGASLSDNYSVY
ncbi:translocase of chloroplast 159, chloroplastic isoform X3 [Argentina anserina]|uniref:translocase of chloroplast 159, chloroplastic isoform X3 n=1 Tax=Argentina anserina TaxID=57926 RepID=UPI002176364E|nr:translocase of chloroplast 159, chloroplastic isoform X3 [Potentilla anserina]